MGVEGGWRRDRGVWRETCSDGQEMEGTYCGGWGRVHSRNIMIDSDIKQVYIRRARRDREQGGIVHDNLPCGGSGSIYLYILS